MPLSAKDQEDGLRIRAVSRLKETKAIMAKEGDESTAMLLLSQLNYDQLFNILKGGSTFIGYTELKEGENPNLIITAEQY